VPGESKQGFAVCRTADFTAWEYVADHRGETVYSTETGDPEIVSLPGDYPEVLPRWHLLRPTIRGTAASG
jgi:hypothetical protein